MILLYALALLAQADHYDNFAYYKGQCVTLVVGESPLHSGLPKGDCEDIVRADRELNLVYRRKIASLSANDRTYLRQSEREWIKSVKVICRLADDALIESAPDYDCFMREVKKRINYISAFKHAPSDHVPTSKTATTRLDSS